MTDSVKSATITGITTNKIEAPLIGSSPQQIREYIAKRLADLEGQISETEQKLVALKDELKNWKKFKLENT